MDGGWKTCPGDRKRVALILVTCCLANVLSGPTLAQALPGGSVFAQRAVAIPYLSGYSLPNNLRWSSVARSTIDCFRRCLSDDLCATFTFTRGQSSGPCRGHDRNATQYQTSSILPQAQTLLIPSRSTVEASSIRPMDGTTQTATTTKVTAASAILSVGSFSATPPSVKKPVLHGTCTADADCSYDAVWGQWGCYNAGCQCYITQYFSVSTNTCVSACGSSSSYVNDYLLYDNYDLTFTSLPIIYNSLFQSYDQCKTLCNRNSVCSGFVHVALTSSCVGYGTPTTSLSLVSFGVLGTSYTSRNCA